MDAPTTTLSKDVLNQTATHTLVPPTDAELADYSLVDADKLVMLAFSNLQTAARIYRRDGLTQPQMVERLSLLGIKCSVRAIQRVFTELRKANDPNFKPVGSSKRAVAYKKAAAKLQNRQFGGIAPEPDEVTNRKNCGMSQTDDSHSSPIQPLPENSDESTFIECNSYSPSTTSVVEPSLRQSNGRESECSQVSDVYEGLVSCEEEQDADPMDTRTYDPNDASDKFHRIEQLIGDIVDIHRELFEGGLSEGQWQDLSQQYGALQYFADIRWQRRRMEMERRRGEFDRLLNEASMGVSPSTGEVPQLDQR